MQIPQIPTIANLTGPYSFGTPVSEMDPNNIIRMLLAANQQCLLDPNAVVIDPGEAEKMSEQTIDAIKTETGLTVYHSNGSMFPYNFWFAKVPDSPEADSG